MHDNYFTLAMPECKTFMMGWKDSIALTVFTLSSIATL